MRKTLAIAGALVGLGFLLSGCHAAYHHRHHHRRHHVRHHDAHAESSYHAPHGPYKQRHHRSRCSG